MDEFWEWMKENDYCLEKNIVHRIWISSTYYEEIKFTEPMLIGYMIEYLLLNNKKIILDVHTNINDLYNYIQKEIKEKNDE